jgi:hypothetical protein
MYEDYDTECWTGSHLKWTLIVDLPSLFLWGFTVPLLALRILYKN